MSLSQTLQHKGPLSEKEIKHLSWLFEELVLADKELAKAEKPEIARQKWMHKAFDLVVYLRLLGEYIAWEYDLTQVIEAMEKLHQWLEGIIQITQDETYKQHAKLLKEDIEGYRDPSCEIFLRTAEALNHEVAIKLVEANKAFRKTIDELSQTKQVFPEGYKSLVLSLKAFGLAYKNYKSVAGALTKAQCQQIFAPVGEQVPVDIPPLEE